MKSKAEQNSKCKSQQTPRFPMSKDTGDRKRINDVDFEFLF